MRTPRISGLRAERTPDGQFERFASTTLARYLAPAEVEEVRRAWLYASEAHRHQRRLSGEPYVTHPLAVAKILADMSLDAATLEAALLHDVIEDTPAERAELVELFGQEVAALVDGVTKLTQIRFDSRREAQAENFRKMVLAMVADVRVIVIKLADRLHNMRTLGAMPPAKRRRIARETLEIYAPIAQRLGMRKLRLELEDIGFRSLYPDRYRVLGRAVRRGRGQRVSAVPKMVKILAERSAHSGLQAEVTGRDKALYSIYRKMREKQLLLAEVMDIHGIRMVTDSVDDCYRLLGVVHAVYKPVPGLFKDYIAIPKNNGYQSLHTVIVGPTGQPVEVQIRTEVMERIAENGIAAHWMYKTGQGAAVDELRTREWLSHLEDIRADSATPVEFLEHVKVDLAPEEVYVFTPKGQIIRLPRGATPVDFAYAVHTDVGNACVSAKVDRRVVSLRTQLKNGQTVEIVTARSARPNPAWLNYVVSAKARSALRHYLRDLEAEDAIKLGRRMLTQSLSQHKLNLKRAGVKLTEVATQLKAQDANDLLRRIGNGEFPAPIVAQHFLNDQGSGPGGIAKPIEIRGTEGMAVTLARCCHPIPGDRIAGLLTRGKGLVVHRVDCKNLAAQKDSDRVVDVAFNLKRSRSYPVEMRLELMNERGVLASVASTVSTADANILHAQVYEREDQTAGLKLEVSVRDRVHVARIMRHLRKTPSVLRVTRS
ncbi:MAG: bifunctional (p)ppGpp synthetase/guanosine-3',5'-bis(diphosphate) 3'-pyrophosphohydrolase [Gammaproteobacteria bacterium]|nr:bifunctional (p)ppGpp synthetase/guanosine-3',5'-bis(diphosphate) 3'-pyrophosphohydrolase [Gammaproteobacteria bacterium]